MGVALLVGVPVGVVAGRAAWTVFASQIGVAPTAVVPLGLVSTATLAVAVLASVVGERPARAAAHTLTGPTLRPSASARVVR